MFNIEEELKKLPARPGVYIMHDADDTIIYVGKAISLKNRVRQYFQGSRNLGIRKEQMVKQTPDLNISSQSFRAGGSGPGVQPHKRTHAKIQHSFEG